MCICREGCSKEEFEGLVQRNMAANCGMDYAFMTEFMHAVLHRESQLLRYTCCTQYPHHVAVLVCFCNGLVGVLFTQSALMLQFATM